jgi:hypothetical protein
MGRYDRPLRVSHLDADGCGKAEPEPAGSRAEESEGSTGGNPRVEVGTTRGRLLDDDSVFGQEVAECGEYVRGAKRFACGRWRGGWRDL